MNLTKEFNILFNHKTINQNRVTESVRLCKYVSISFAEWINKDYVVSNNGLWRNATIISNTHTTQELFEIFENEQSKKK
jgi:hypothetical protein